MINLKEILCSAKTTGNLDAFKTVFTGLDHAEQESVRSSLLSDFDLHHNYRDAVEWNLIVRICELLGVTGWGQRERLDARSRFNGDCWQTEFINRYGDNRLKFAFWTKRKSGWGITTYTVKTSHDFPRLEETDWQRIKDVVIVDVQGLMTQRNYQRQCPVIMGVIGKRKEVTDIVFNLKRELSQLFNHRLEPEIYGEALEFLFLSLNCIEHDDVPGGQLAVGLFSQKKRSFECILYFPKEFAGWDNNLQKKYFRDKLMAVVDAVGEQVKKKNLKYNYAKFRKDVEAVLDEWRVSSKAQSVLKPGG